MEEQAIDVNDPQQAVKDVYSKVWDEFYDWEPKYVRSTLKAVEETRQGYSDAFFDDCVEWGRDDVHIDEDEGADADYVPVEIIKNQIIPFPPYDYCTPTVYNFNNVWDALVPADEVDARTWITFVPFTDEIFPRMDEYLKCCVCDWELDIWNDPDLDVITLETVKRLVLAGWTLDKINDVGALLHLSHSGESEHEGFLQTVKKRTLLKVTHPNWSQRPLDGLTPIIERRPEPFTTSLMCPRCTETECLPHQWSGRRIIPIVSNRIEIEHPSQPCGGDCTLRHQLIPFEWPDALVDELRDLVIHGFVTANPCDLGVVMKQPCWQVFEKLNALEPSFSMVPSQDDISQVEPPVTYSNEMVHRESCLHQGPCSSANNCPCVEAGVWCERACHCSENYIRDVNARASVLLLAVARTLNGNVTRKGVNAVGLSGRNFGCRNRAIQTLNFKKTSVRPSQWGWGLFAAETIRRDELIVEYTGEIHRTARLSIREIISSHLGRNYNFGLNDEYDVDAAELGNEARIINHDVARVNCVVEPKVVNGDQRLGVYASEYIKEGEEIFMDYGPNFLYDWKGGRDGRHARKDKGKQLKIARDTTR